MHCPYLDFEGTEVFYGRSCRTAHCAAPYVRVMIDSGELDLAGWSNRHAVVVLTAAAACAIVGRAWPLSCSVLVSFAFLICRNRNAWTPVGRFGGANAVTAFRLFVVASIPIAFHDAAGTVLAMLGFAILALDGLDGWLARRGNLASEFGAHFDMETDAFFVLVVAFELWQRHQLGAWILIAGLLRYVYVLCLALAPPRGGDMPRSRFGRHAFTLLVSGLCAALALPHALGVIAAIVGTTGVSASFLRSFYWSYRGGPRPLRLS